jgi:hypothetical protein
LEEGDASRYAVTTTLRELRHAELARTAEFAGIFAGKFLEISFGLKKGARVEAVIDAIEALDEAEAGGLRVSYPSDCSECEIVVAGVDARVRCTGASLEMVFPQAGGPAELMDGFVAVRGAFAISQVLADAMHAAQRFDRLDPSLRGIFLSPRDYVRQGERIDDKSRALFAKLAHPVMSGLELVIDGLTPTKVTPRRMKGATVAGKSMPCASPQAVTTPL